MKPFENLPKLKEEGSEESIKCKKCHKPGSLQLKEIPIRGKIYKYWYIAHPIGLHRVKWHYWGKRKISEAEPRKKRNQNRSGNPKPKAGPGRGKKQRTGAKNATVENKPKPKKVSDLGPMLS
jgi:hypothetical protein